jgi:N-acetylglutamate synthase-like GNAT family acetyltransferase
MSEKWGREMENTTINFTNRMNKIIKNAELEVNYSSSKILNPLHLLIACLQEKSGVLAEISLKCSLDISLLKIAAEQINIDSSQDYNKSAFFDVSVTNEVINVMENSIGFMKRYKQVYVNEGHLLKALLTSDVVNKYITEEDKESITTLGTTSRDMITHLANYIFPDVTSHIVRRVNNKDINKLVTFVEKDFSYEWSQTIATALNANNFNIYIAVNENEDIIGFAAYDVYKNNKCYIGPMGVSLTNRIRGVGYSLLHHCLRDMKEIGYEYAIIGGAGPIEFYEKACNAVVIPKAI